MRNSRPVVDGRGRYFVAPIADPGRIAVFRPDGQILHVIGQLGSGPGEFRRIEHLAAIPGDSILVFDRGNRRIAVLDPTLRVARTVPFGGLVFDAVRSRNGQFVVSAMIATRQAVGHLYHVVGDSGLVRSFGATTETSQREAGIRNIRALASARAGGFWAGHLSRYEIDRADSTEQPTRAIARSVSWFQPWTQSHDAPPWLVRPQPKLTDIREDQRGYIWTLVAVAHPRWKPMSAQNRSVREPLRTIPDVNAIDEILERVVEVIDPRTGSVLTSRRLPGSYLHFVGDDTIYRLRETPDGTIEIIVFRLSLLDGRRR